MKKYLSLAAILLAVLLTSCQTAKVTKVPVTFQFVRLDSDKLDTDFKLGNAMPSGVQVLKVTSSVHIFVETKLQLDDSEISKVELLQDQMSNYLVQIQLNESGTEKLSELTANNVGRRLAVIVDGKLVIAPTIAGRITNGKVIIFYSESEKVANHFYRQLAVETP